MESSEHSGAYIYLPANLHKQADFSNWTFFIFFFLDMLINPIISQIHKFGFCDVITFDMNVGQSWEIEASIILLFHLHFIFPEPVDSKELCVVTLNQKEINQLKEAIEDLYYFEFVLGMVAQLVMRCCIFISH